MAVEITRTDVSGRELRAAAARTKDVKAVRRIVAIAFVLEGADRKTVAEACGMDRQTLRDWVHRYNAEEIAGLSNRYSAGRVDTSSMNAHLVEISKTVGPGAHAVLVMDGAGWHNFSALRIPDNITS